VHAPFPLLCSFAFASERAILRGLRHVIGVPILRVCPHLERDPAPGWLGCVHRRCRRLRWRAATSHRILLCSWQPARSTQERQAQLRYLWRFLCYDTKAKCVRVPKMAWRCRVRVAPARSLLTAHATCMPLLYFFRARSLVVVAKTALGNCGYAGAHLFSRKLFVTPRKLSP
jgi:hypothetical protein